MGMSGWVLVIGVLLGLAVGLDILRKMHRERRNRVILSSSAKRLARRGIVEEEPPVSEVPVGGSRPLRNEIPTPLPVNRVEPVPDDSGQEEIPLEQGLSAIDDDLPLASPVHGQGGRRAKGQKELSGHTLQTSLFDQESERRHESGDSQEPMQIVTLNVVAKSPEGFAGNDLMHILLACDCRFGKMDIFHRYEEKNAEGSIQFSIVNMVEPGSFNLEQISTFTTPGVSFFLLLPGPADPLNAFECMVETAGCLVRNLNGRLLDDAHSSVSEQTLEHCRQKIRDFLQQQLVAP